MCHSMTRTDAIAPARSKRPFIAYFRVALFGEKSVADCPHKSTFLGVHAWVEL